MEKTLSKSALLKATTMALFAASALLILFILPAEFNIDLTGVGKKLGLTALNSDVQSAKRLATINSSMANTTTNNKDQPLVSEDTINVTIPAENGIEFKFKMRKYQTLKYDWLTDGSAVFFDLHGEPEGDTSGYFESYAEATASNMKGQFIAPFNGSHGWYWKNTSDVDVTVQLHVSGEYAIEGLK